MDAKQLAKIKLLLRENDVPYFEDIEIEQYSEIYKSFNELMFQLLMIKAQDSSLNISGLSTSNDANYFKTLAQQYKMNNTGILGG